MKIGDKVVLIDPDYRNITGDAVGTIVSEYISDSQWNMLHPVQQWNIASRMILRKYNLEDYAGV